MQPGRRNLWQCARGRRMTPPSWFPTWFMPRSFSPPASPLLLHVYPLPAHHYPPTPTLPLHHNPISGRPLPKAKVIKLACCYFRHFKMQISSKLCPSQACLIAPVGAPGVVRSEKLGASRSRFWINCARQNNEQFSPRLSTAFIRLPPIRASFDCGQPAS